MRDFLKKNILKYFFDNLLFIRVKLFQKRETYTRLKINNITFLN